MQKYENITMKNFVTKFSVVVSLVTLLGIFPLKALANDAPYGGGDGDGWFVLTGDSAFLGWGASSAEAQSFNLSGVPVAMSTLTVQFSGACVPTDTSDLRLIIPSGLSATWDTSDTSALISGSASGKISSTVSFAGSNKIAVFDVMSNFADGDQLVITGLNFANFSALSLTYQYLGVDTNGDSVADFSDGYYKMVVRGGGAINQYQGGSGDGWSMVQGELWRLADFVRIQNTRLQNTRLY